MDQPMKQDQVFTEEQAMKELKKGYKKAEVLLKNKSKLDEILERLEKKLKKIPNVGEKLSHVPVFIQLIKSYITKEYTNIPIASVLGIISALLYVLSPIDIIPDFIPGAGLLDDAVVVGVCLRLVDDDVKEFIQWRDEKMLILDTVIE